MMLSDDPHQWLNTAALLLVIVLTGEQMISDRWRLAIAVGGLLMVLGSGYLAFVADRPTPEGQGEVA